jgi:predicted esterase
LKTSLRQQRRIPWLPTLALVVSVFACSLSAAEQKHELREKELPLPGEVFLVEGHTAFLISGHWSSTTRELPWVWYAPTLPGLPGPEERWMFERFVQAGIAVAGIDVGESFGSPAGQKLFDALYREMTTRGYSLKPVLLGRSRGGLMALSWAVENPEKIGGFAGIYPVCNLASYPGIEKAAPAFAMPPNQLRPRLEEFNPIDRLAPLAKAAVPLFAIHGDSDKVVPLNENSGLMRERYRALGGSMELFVPPGQGHNMWPGFFQSRDLVRFVKAHVGPNLTVLSPRDYQVVQRSGRNQGSLLINGEYAGIAEKLVLEARLIIEGKPRRWRRVQADSSAGVFHARWEVPGGGWYRLEVRGVSGRQVMAESVVEHVGVGEVFVVAGQSNAANHGAEKQKTRTGLVAAFDGKTWRLANDPEPGASGGGGSFMPPFGDALVDRFHVPVGIAACGVGATSVREWLPKGSNFPNPPTLTNQVQQLRDGTWTSKGMIFASFTERMRELGPGGFRAVLWHQGESDANQADPTRTLSGRLYREYLEKLIRASRHEIGWDAPWFVAQASYHAPGDEGSPDIRAAQTLIWMDGFALPGPDTDALKGGLRDSGGQGVHFSGPGLREHGARWVEQVSPWLEGEIR